jgi:hypothetical protein
MLLNVGMPGVGLGGIFYVVAALLMPFVEVARAIRARRAGIARPAAARRWGLVMRQAALAIAVLGAGWSMGAAIVRSQRVVAVAVESATETAAEATHHASLAPGTLVLGLVLLTLVLGLIETVRLVSRPPGAGARRVDPVRVDPVAVAPADAAAPPNRARDAA